MKTLFVAYANPMPERDAEFSEWYSEIHIPEVLAIAGFIDARRFKLAPVQVVNEQPYQYMTIYEIDSDNVAQTLRNLAGAMSSMTVGAALDASNFSVSVYEAVD